MENNIINEIIWRTISLEGGYVNDPNDAGGETNFGISKRSYPSVDIKNLTREQAIEIYRHDFWDKSNLGLLTDEKVASKVFDIGVNMGVSIPIRFLQDIVNVKEDGILGTTTAEKINLNEPGYIVQELRKCQILRYADIVIKNPIQLKFLKGWINRAFT